MVASTVLLSLIKRLGLTEFTDIRDSLPPVPGVWQCRIIGPLGFNEGYARFDGKYWSYIFVDPEAAAVAGCVSYLSTNVVRYWRGLAQDPADLLLQLGSQENQT